MRIHHLQHVPFEDLGSMEGILAARGHTLTSTHLYRGDPLPPVDHFDWLIVMGGPMGVKDEVRFPWMTHEKGLIDAALHAEKRILGICLGAQLIAERLGAAVYLNRHREIGWFDLERLPEATGSLLGEALPQSIEAFHWHGDTFAIPEGATPLAQSEACDNQGFIYADRVVGFQFHLESTPASVAALIAECGDELDGSRYVQSAEQMLQSTERFVRIREAMQGILQTLEGGDP